VAIFGSHYQVPGFFVSLTFKSQTTRVSAIPDATVILRGAWGIRTKKKNVVIIIDSAEYVGPFATLVYGIIILIIIIAGLYVCYYLLTGRRL
jgi:hypothetical protein